MILMLAAIDPRRAALAARAPHLEPLSLYRDRIQHNSAR